MKEETKKTSKVRKLPVKIKKVPMVRIDKFLLDYGTAGTCAASYMNPATTTTIRISEDEKSLSVRDSEGMWVFPNNQRTKKMLAMFFDYIDPAKLMDENTEQDK